MDCILSASLDTTDVSKGLSKTYWEVRVWFCRWWFSIGSPGQEAGASGLQARFSWHNFLEGVGNETCPTGLSVPVHIAPK